MLLYSLTSRSSNAKQSAAEPHGSCVTYQENTEVEPSIIFLCCGKIIQGFFSSSVYAFHCLLVDSIFLFVVLCYFNGLIAGTS